MARREQKNEELTGVFDRERNVFQDNTEERTIIGELEDDTTIKGRAMRGALEYGMTYRFSGYWFIHERYGRQFIFSSFCIATPNSERGTVKYLAKANGIGNRRAQEIWNLYGPEALNVLRDKPELVAREVKGMTLEIAKGASELFKVNIALEQTTIAVTTVLANRGFPRALVEKVISKWGAAAADKIKSNPYCLLIFAGVGFASCDKLYLELGHDPAALIRQSLCLYYAMHSDREGHTWFDLEFLSQKLGEAIAGATLELDKAIAWGIEHGLIVTTERNGTLYAAERRKSMDEDEIVYRVKMLIGDSFADPFGLNELPTEWDTDSRLRWPHPDELTDCSDHQKEGYCCGTRFGTSRLAILAGSPGTGKTHTAAQVIGAYGRKNGHGRTLVVAPTGIAAKRITKFLAERQIHVRGKTIHSALGIAGVGEDGEFAFTYGPDEPLPYSLIVIDEGSMKNTTLAARLFSAIRKDAIVIIIGDPNQLAPVGHGAPLRDMIKAGVPTGHLTKIRRNSGLIVESCKNIRETGTFDCPSKFDFANGVNLVCIGNGRPKSQIELLKSTISSIKLLGQYDTMWDSQIIVPVNDKSELGRHPLNKVMQEYMNPHGERVTGSPFRQGDKIVCTKNGQVSAHKLNDWKFDEDEWRTFLHEEINQDGKVSVANGEFGKVLRVEPKLTYVQLFHPLRVVKIPRGAGNTADDTACDFDLGYVCSGHKSQGAEWPFAIIMVDEYYGAKMTCSREWIYTTISRGKIGTILIGNLATARGFCQKSSLWNRQTLLLEKLTGAMEPIDYVEAQSIAV